MMQSSAEEGVPPAEAWVSEAALVAELSGMRIRALNARAEELGVPAHKLDEAEDTPDTKGALVSLIVLFGYAGYDALIIVLAISHVRLTAKLRRIESTHGAKRTPFSYSPPFI